AADLPVPHGRAGAARGGACGGGGGLRRLPQRRPDPALPAGPLGAEGPVALVESAARPRPADALFRPGRPARGAARPGLRPVRRRFPLGRGGPGMDRGRAGLSRRPRRPGAPPGGVSDAADFSDPLEASVAQETILIVDDSPTETRLVAEPLRGRGYRVLTAADGEEALEKVAQERPHLVVLDVVLPKKNGFQVCRALKTSPDLSRIKLLL